MQLENKRYKPPFWVELSFVIPVKSHFGPNCLLAENQCTKHEGNHLVKRGRHYIQCCLLDQNLVYLREIVAFFTVTNYL